jgi:hypothetical protein
MPSIPSDQQRRPRSTGGDLRLVEDKARQAANRRRGIARYLRAHGFTLD